MKINSSRVRVVVVLAVSIGILIHIWGFPDSYRNILAFSYSQRVVSFFLSTLGKALVTFIVFVSITLTFGLDLYLWVIERKSKKRR